MFTIQEIIKKKLLVKCTPEQAERLVSKHKGFHYTNEKYYIRDFVVIGLYNPSITSINWMPGSEYGTNYLMNNLGYTGVINFNQVDMCTDKKIIGYKCIKAYPGVNLGEVHKCLKGGFQDQFPEFWQPVYEEEKITLSGYDLVIKDNKAVFGCQSFRKEEIEFFRKFLQVHESLGINITGGNGAAGLTIDTLDKILNQLN